MGHPGSRRGRFLKSSSHIPLTPDVFLFGVRVVLRSPERLNRVQAFEVRPAQMGDLEALAEMCGLLWPDSPLEEHRREMQTTLQSGMSGTLPTAVLVAQDRDGLLRGFLQVGLRSHADGCDVSRPVGFVEGWFVHEQSRYQGIGRTLMRAAETWSRQHGCQEMASDTWIDQDDSIRAHEKLGFEVVDRCVHFRKQL
jgi:aminoglycoside 6'-N-acetyltransferase I